jgi:hypothetical protein
MKNFCAMISNGFRVVGNLPPCALCEGKGAIPPIQIGGREIHKLNSGDTPLLILSPFFELFRSDSFCSRQKPKNPNTGPKYLGKFPAKT